MQFLYPLFLWGLLALAIPVIIHLFYFRRFKKVYFTNVRFLKALKEETSSRSKLRDLLVLLMRLLAILFLVFAFAQPFLAKEGEADERLRAVAVYLDNSYSMMSTDSDIPLIDHARVKASEIVESFTDSDRFLLLTNDLLPRHQRWVDKKTVLSFIEEVELSPSVTSLSIIKSRIDQLLDQAVDNKPYAYFISDYQKTIMDLAPTEESHITLVPLSSVKERNISIDTCWLESPILLDGQTANLMVKLTNYDKDAAENVRLTMTYAGETKPVGNFNIEPFSSKTDTITFKMKGSGWQDIKLEISDYPIQFDDSYYISIEVPESIKVLNIYDGQINRYINAAFASIPEYELTSLSLGNIDYSSLPNYRLIILQDLKKVPSGLRLQLREALEKGQNVMIFPSKDGDDGLSNLISELNIGSMGSFESGTFVTSEINPSSFIFTDVFESIPSNMKLPSTSGRYRLNTRSAEYLLKFRDGRHAVEAHQINNGIVYLSAIPLDRSFSDLSTTAEVFIPLLHRAAIETNADKQIAFTIEKDEQIELDIASPQSDMQYAMKGPVEFIPGIKKLGNRTVISLFNQIEYPGFYSLMSGDNTHAVLAFNFSRKESDPATYTIKELKNLFPDWTIVDQVAAANLSQFISVQDRGTILWRICLFLCLLFLLVEVLILRFWKV